MKRSHEYLKNQLPGTRNPGFLAKDQVAMDERKEFLRRVLARGGVPMDPVMAHHLGLADGRDQEREGG